MHEQINFSTINAVPNADIQIIFSFYIRTAISSGEPVQFILSAALDRRKAESESCEFPVYIPAPSVFHSEAHKELLQLLRSGVPWVPVKCRNFQVYRYKSNDHYHYFAHADSFQVADYSKVTEV